MTDIPVYNEKEISMKDISFRYKSDRRAQDVRGTSVLRRPEWNGDKKPHRG